MLRGSLWSPLKIIFKSAGERDDGPKKEKSRLARSI
jgi:hypothetical protein